MKLISLFSGIGAFEKALDDLNIEYDLLNYCEIDKYASKSYSAIHGVSEEKNLWDITKINYEALPTEVDLVTYGFPCQDISLAGKQKGLFNSDGTKTRSGLFFDALKVITHTHTKVAIAENVKNLTSKKFSEQFKLVLQSLEEAGYNNYFQVLNAKDFGIPQNRERVFIVSIRKDLDNHSFIFPEGFPLQLRLKDMMQDDADEKFYLSDAMFKYAFNMEYEHQGIGFSDGVDRSFINPEIAQTIGCRSAADQRSGTTNFVSDYFDEPLQVSEMKKMIANNQVLQICNVMPTATRENPNQGRVYDPEGISPTLNCMSGGNRQPFVLVKEATKQGYAAAAAGDSINLEQPNSTTRRGRVGHQVAQTLTTSCNQAVVESSINNTLRIRKLTPKECFRLMGFSDEDFSKAEAVNSNTQLYKQAGNSIVCTVPYYIIKNLIETNIFEEKEVKTMELKISEITEPMQIISFNYEELKNELQEKAKVYASIVYTEDKIQDAKKDRANLNALKKSLNDERIRREKEFMKPFTEFKNQINEIIKIIDQPCMVIDQQVKAFEDQKKKEKQFAIEEAFNAMNFPVELCKIMDPKWLNSSVSMKQIHEALEAKHEQILKDLEVIQTLDFSFEAKVSYLDTLNLSQTLQYVDHLKKTAEAKRKYEEEQKQITNAEIAKEPEPVAVENEEEPERQWISFRAFLSESEAKALGAFLRSKHIKYQAI